MNNLDNLAIMNYLQGHGLIGGVIHRKPKKHLMKYDLEGGVITDATRTGLAKYRAFIAYEKKNNDASHQEAVAKWKAHKPKHAIKKTPRERKPRLNKKIKSYINEGLSIDEARNLFELSQSKKKKRAKKMSAVDFLSSVADIQNKPSSGKNKSAFFKGLNYNFNPTKGDKTLYEVHTMRLPELRKYAKKYIKLSKLDTTTGKRVQLRKKEIIKELGVK